MNTCLDKLMGGYADSRYSLPVITDALPLEMTGIQRAVLSVLGAFSVLASSSVLLSAFLLRFAVYNSPYEAEFWAYKVVTTLPHSLDNSNAMLGGFNFFRKTNLATGSTTTFALRFLI